MISLPQLSKFLSITFVFLCLGSVAQTPQWKWAKKHGGTKNDVGNQVMCDPDGNILSWGTFESASIQFGSTTLPNMVPGGTNRPAYYIAKHDSLGNVLWAKTFPAQMNDLTGAGMDQQGNLYLTGRFYGTLTLGGHSITLINGTVRPFVVKYNKTGQVVWLKAKSLYSDESQSVTQLTGFTAFNDHELITSGLCLNDTLDGHYIPGAFWISKMDTAGNYHSFVLLDSLWLYATPGLGGVSLTSIVVDTQHNVYLSGTYSPHTQFYQQSWNLDTLAGHNNGELFLAKFDSGLNFLWSNLSYCYNTHTSSGNAIIGTTAMDIDQQGNIYRTGRFQADTIAFDATHGHFFAAVTSGNFITKYNTNGDVIWDSVFVVTSPFSRSFTGLCTDKVGNIYCCGKFSGPLSFSGISAYASGNATTFLVKMDPDGRAKWLQTNTLNGQCNISIDEDGKGNIYATGNFILGNIAFGSTTLTMTTPPPTFPYAGDLFLFRLGNCYPAGPALSPATSQHLCNNDSLLLTPSPADSYVWSTGDTSSTLSVHSAGDYFVYGIDSLGCYAASDTISITTGIADSSVIVTGTTLNAAAGGAIYQWVDCQTGYQPLINETNQSFLPAQSGTYALIIEQNNCVDTSSCYAINISTVSLKQEEAAAAFRLYPNPGNGIFSVDLSEPGLLQVIDLPGKKVVEIPVQKGRTVIDWTFLQAGMYQVLFNAGGKQCSQKMIIQH